MGFAIEFRSFLAAHSLHAPEKLKPTFKQVSGCGYGRGLESSSEGRASLCSNSFSLLVCFTLPRFGDIGTKHGDALGTFVFAISHRGTLLFLFSHGLPVVVASPVTGGGFILCGVAVHAGLEIGSAFGVFVLQEIVVATLAEFYFADFFALLAKNDVFFRVPSRRFLRFVETSKQFTPVFDFSVWGSFESSWHAHNNALGKEKYQAEISP